MHKRAPNRSHKVIMSDEARVLKELRMSCKRDDGLPKKGYSMREAGDRLGWSNSYISHIENGRTDIPEKAPLLRILDLYRCTYKYFLDKVVRSKKERKDDPYKTATELISRLNPQQLKAVEALTRHFLNVR